MTMERATITIDVSDESILWICDKCNVRKIYVLSDRTNAISEMRLHRHINHGKSDSWRMHSTRGNHYDYRI